MLEGLKDPRLTGHPPMATTVSLAEFKSLAPAAYEALLTLSQAAQAGGIEALPQLR